MTENSGAAAIGELELPRTEIASVSKMDAPTTSLSRTVSRLMIPFALLAFIAPFIGLMFCAAPREDDFLKAINAPPSLNGYDAIRLPNAFSAAWAEYTVGGGSARWFTNLLQSFFMGNFGLSHAYGWLLLLVMVATVAAMAYFFTSFFAVSYSRALLVAGVLYTVWIATSWTPLESIFWLTGAMEYQLPFAGIMVLAGLLCKPRQTPLTYCLLGALSIAIPAQHEIAGLFLVVCLFVAVIGARFRKAPLFPWLLCFGLAAFSYGAVLLSPAMTFKLSAVASVHNPDPLLMRIRSHGQRAVGHALDWILNPAALLGMLCIPTLLWAPEDRSREVLRPRWIALAGIAAICTLFVEYVVTEMATFSVVFPTRVLGWYQCLFLVLCVCALLVGLPEISRMRFSFAARITLYALFGLSLLTSANFHQAERDLRGPARAWRRGNIARLSLQGGAIQLEPLPPKPVLFQESGLSGGGGCWVNQGMAVYLHADEVSLKGPKENHWGGGNLCDPDVSSY
jgi:hypothetical protein